MGGIRMTATRVIVISDLHLGGTARPMMSHPGCLADFIRDLPRKLNANEALEVVIAGDFVDFLAIAPFESWTSDPIAACQKLDQTMLEPSPFAPVFRALGKLVTHRRTSLTIMIGNHDVEMALPQVQEAFLKMMGGSSRRVRFVADGRAYRVGKVLIEHGNRYDDANR